MYSSQIAAPMPLDAPVTATCMAIVGGWLPSGSLATGARELRAGAAAFLEFDRALDDSRGFGRAAEAEDLVVARARGEHRGKNCSMSDTTRRGSALTSR